MKHFAPVVPITIAEYLKKMGVLGNYHLLLAHDVLAYPDHYQRVYGGDEMDIIMDNSLVELGVPLGIDTVVKAANVVGANRVVLPDYLGDLSLTLQSVNKELERWHQMSPAEKEGISLVGVVQGKTLEECKLCVDEYAYHGIQPSIPRVVTSILGSREYIIRYAHEKHNAMSMHLLGFSDDLKDDIQCTKLPGVKGIDSAVPVRAGYKNIILNTEDPELSDKIGKREDYWERTPHPDSLSQWQLETAIHNICRFRNWIN